MTMRPKTKSKTKQRPRRTFSAVSSAITTAANATSGSTEGSAADVSAAESPAPVVERFWAYAAAITSGSVTLLAFLIPSIQYQWDLFRSRQVIEQYESLGDACAEEERFDVAEKAYEKAFELSLQSRLDIEMKRLSARVRRMSMITEWATEPPEDLEDVDFQMMLHMQTGKHQSHARVLTLHSYGSFLAGSGKIPEARAALQEAISLEPKNALLHVSMGNVEDQAGRKDAAIKSYLEAIHLEPENITAHYNLGLVYRELGRLADAIKSLAEALRLNPDDKVTKEQLEAVRRLSEQGSCSLRHE